VLGFVPVCYTHSFSIRDGRLAKCWAVHAVCCNIMGAFINLTYVLRGRGKPALYFCNKKCNNVTGLFMRGIVSLRREILFLAGLF
jgi:hypothetical protein